MEETGMTLRFKMKLSTQKNRRKRSRSLRLMILPIFLAALFITVLAYQSGSPSAYNFTLTDIDGRVFSLNDFKGKIIVLNVMSTSCPICLAEIPHLKEVASKYGVEDVIFISVSIDPNYNTNNILRDYIQRNEITWMVAQDTTYTLTNTFQVTNIPTTIIIDTEGVVQNIFEGLVESGTLIQVIDDLLH